MSIRNFGPFLAIFAVSVSAAPASTADWPMWRHDAQRSAASPQELPAELHLHWHRDYPPQIPAWPDQEKMQFDAAYEPVVLGQSMFLNSSRHDCVRALDVATGLEKWTYFADGPVRFAPVAWEGRVYFSSDDGYLYCVAAADGKLRWKFRGGPSDRKILGNERLISTWPARGAPVVVDGKVYFAASIWPFMGIFIHALDARTGQPIWTNDGDGSLYMKQPHNTDSFASIAPQGSIVAIGDTLLLPGGRSVPACFDRATGKLLRYQLAENGKRGGGSEVAAMGHVFFNGGAAFNLATEKYLAEVGKQVVLTPDVVYTYAAGSCRALDLKGAETKEIEAVDAKGKATKSTRWSIDEIASCKTPAVETLIKAGNRLYLGSIGQVQAIDISADGRSLIPGWSADVAGKVVRLIAAADRLFAVTSAGRIYCFGDAPATTVARVSKAPVDEKADDALAKSAAAILEAAQARAGYAVVWNAGDGKLVSELVRQSKLHVLAFDPDPARVEQLRRRFVAEDLYGTRLAVHQGEPATVALPSFLASLMICDDDNALLADPVVLAKAFATLRPYGGALCITAKHDQARLRRAVDAARLANAAIEVHNGMTLLKRAGPLPGSANWTHEHADPANTRVSKDQLVKAPLGILWFGGPTHDGILPRHGHGPQPQVIDGRLIIEGVDMMRALDIYTGRLLWETKIPGVGQFFNNIAHQPGANASGSNFACTGDSIYVALERSCLRLEPATGKIMGEIHMPRVPGLKDTPRWGYINVAGDYLIAGADPLFDPKSLPKPPADPRAGDDKDPAEAPVKSTTLSKVLQLLKSPRDNLSASRHIVVMDRRTGQMLWSRSAKYAFRHNAICVGGGRLYAIDRLSGDQLAQFTAKDEEPPHPFRVLALDLKTGDGCWQADADVFGTWLSYSIQRDVLVEAGRVARDTINDEPKGMRAYRARDGAVLWHEPTYVGPAMIHGDTILQGQGACDLLTGAVKKRVDPITGELVPWVWARNYGCNTPAASEHLMTFRSGAAGYFDLCHDGGTGNFGGFRSSCTNNLIVAGGVLTVPEYTRTCTCAYQNQTSVGLIHMPEAETWTFFGTKELKGQVKRLGVNFGAPGDRKDDDGTLWLEFPITGGLSPAVNVKTKPEMLETFRRHSSQVTGKWNKVGACGAKGISDVSILLDNEPGPRTFTVRLIFAEPERIRPGERVFDVEVQGRRAFHDLDIVKEAGAPLRTLVKEVAGVEVENMLTIRLTSSAHATNRTTILCGIEVIAEDKKQR